jgi:hypothetical protein
MTVFSNDGKTRQRPKATKFDDVSLKKQHWLDAELEWHQLKLQLLMQTFRFLAAWPSSHLEKNNRHSFFKSHIAGRQKWRFMVAYTVCRMKSKRRDKNASGKISFQL